MKKVRFAYSKTTHLRKRKTMKRNTNMSLSKSNTLRVLQWILFFRAVRKEMSYYQFDSHHKYLFFSSLSIKSIGSFIANNEVIIKSKGLAFYGEIKQIDSELKSLDQRPQ